MAYSVLYGLLCLIAHAHLSFSLELPKLYYSMNGLSNSSEMEPVIGNKTLWSGDVSTLTKPHYTTGYEGEAILLKRQQVTVGWSSLVHHTCLFAPSSCSGGGITVSMWLNVQEWSDKFATFFWSGGYIFNYPGIAFYPDALDLISFSVVVLLENGTRYVAGISQDLIGTNQWTHVTATWSPGNGIRIYVNGTDPSVYTRAPATTTDHVRNFQHTLPLVLGASDLFCYIDELKIWYRELTASEVAQTLSVGTGAAETTTPTTTAPTTTTTVQTTTTTTASPTTTPTSTTTSTTAAAPVTTSSTTSKATTTTTTTKATPSTTAKTQKPPTKPPIVHPPLLTTESTTTTTTTSEETTVQNFWRTETIIAVSVGAGVALLALIIAIVVCCCLAARRRKEKEEKERKPKPTRV